MKLALKLMVIATLLTSIVACNGEKKVTPKSEDEKTLYALGVMFGGKLKDLSLSNKELSFMVQGLKDSAAGTTADIDLAQYHTKIQEMFRARLAKASEKTKGEGTKYLENFVKGGAKKTESGLAYKVESAGSAKKPAATDIVEVHYHGTLIDGTVFDSSKDRGKTAKFPLNRVIKGWTEGLQLIGEGGKVRLVIPSELAYGEHGAPPKIPGGATLIFDVELIKIHGKPPKKAAKKRKGKK